MHAGLPEPAARRCSIALPALFDPLARCRSVEVDGPYPEYAPKQFCIKMVFSNPSSGHRTSLRNWFVGVASGIKTKELVAGTGKIANRKDIVLTHIHGFLHRGEECQNTHTTGHPMRIDLSKREAVSGLRKGIDGMSVGGGREMMVS